MSGASFEVSGRPQSSDCKVKFNGEEIQNALCGFTIQADASDPVYHVELQVRISDDLAVEVPDANVFVPDETRDLLIKLGWTPPNQP